ncbi:MAG: hypothetical protein M1834_008445 [Cirrosporium novae-zelandiae]|nr:MAG: hypothetical protein M1834_008445 [Cirrosporium novae-zelandiae]
METDIASANCIISDSKLVHPDLPLVQTFLSEAADCHQAAKYLLRRCAGDTDGTEFARFVADWKALIKMFLTKHLNSNYLDRATKRAIAQRDDYKCCITGTRARFWNAWDIFPILPLTAFHIREGRLYDMLGAFIAPSQRGLLLSCTETNSANSVQNHWLLSKEAADAFSKAEIKLKRLDGHLYDVDYTDVGGKPAIFTNDRWNRWRCRLANHSHSKIGTPNPELLEIHCRFSKALRWTKVAADMKKYPHPGHTQTGKSRSRFEPLINGLLAMWLTFPDKIRLLAYKTLKAAGLYLYEPTTMGVQRLPFGMYLKHGPVFNFEGHAAEFGALKLVRSYTSIPVPRPIDLISTSESSFLVTSRIQGDPAGLCIDEYSDYDLGLIAKDLRKYIAELRAIKKTIDPKHAISNAIGEGCLDYRINDVSVGPFLSEKQFSKFLSLGLAPDFIHLVHGDGHEIVFTHADLNMRNILVRNGRISGIVDWENSGWYPEYWEYTKCHFGVRRDKRWLKMVVEPVFEGKYREELRIERQLWDFDGPF